MGLTAWGLKGFAWLGAVSCVAVVGVIFSFFLSFWSASVRFACLRFYSLLCDYLI
ncbi:MAG: hypothetical protein SPE49_07935 [Campylobacter sp.]|uniref:hypothetical protein n=1 Tax=Campylobacter sp. TaxID=205 RepID=UPI002A7ECB09|nr:hypothetical protein [Campylobacter sp.]MCI7587615.1 hypothetical protein [Campylobacter sp.]MDY5115877.1 hypothetical protein [Campylobacter sp.]